MQPFYFPALNKRFIYTYKC